MVHAFPLLNFIVSEVNSFMLLIHISSFPLFVFAKEFVVLSHPVLKTK